MERRLIRSGAASDGFMLIELLAAMLVLAVGVLTTFGVFDASQHANRTSELHEVEIHLAQGELERVEGLPYNQVGLQSAPATSTNPNNPGYYVSGSGCANFRWNQSAGGTGTDALVVNGCSYISTGVSFSGCSPLTTYCNGTVQPSRDVTADEQPTTCTSTSLCYTIHDYITWSLDPVCLNQVGGTNVCPSVSYDYKRVTVEVTNNAPSQCSPEPPQPCPAYAPVAPLLVSGIVSDPHALPLVGSPVVNNPLDQPGTSCTDANGNLVTPCGGGIGDQTPNTWWLSDTVQQTAGSVYSPPTGNDACMHYTDQVVPLLNGVPNCVIGSGLASTCVNAGSQSVLTGCPHPDLLSNAPPPTSIPQEYNFSPNPSGMSPPGGQGRTILHDQLAADCSSSPNADARYAEWWSTPQLASGLNLTGSGGMTLYTNTLDGRSSKVTLCVGVYLETPVTLLGTTLLDPLNLLCGSCATKDTVQLGVAAYTMAAWPAVPTPIQFTFSNLFSAQTAIAGKSLGVRVWVTALSDDIVLHYDAPTAESSVQINSQ